MKFILNGKDIELKDVPEISLLEWLREYKGIKSAKDGCSGQGVCGACLVEIDGKPELACRMKLNNLDGKIINTLEGSEIVEILGKAFVASGAVQCGFCSPGMLMRAKILFEKNNNPTREDVIKAIKNHLCRCTGYVKIVDAIMLAADSLNNNKTVQIKGSKMGDNAPKFEAFERAIGKSLFIDDFEFDGMLHGAICFSKYPRAKVLKIDTTKAKDLDGVIEVFTAEDIPGDKKVGMLVRDWDLYIGEGEITRYIGDVLALVVAKDVFTARKAVKLVDVTYEVLTPVTDVDEALKTDIKIHPNGNLLKQTEIKYGENIEKVFEESDFVVSDVFQTQVIEHAFLETECSIACYENDKLTVYSQGQGIYEDREQIADALGLKKSEVNVKLVPAGGAFGGKEDLTVQAHAALATYHLKVPVKVKLSREESMRMHSKRHPMKMEYKLGCSKDGKFTGLYARITGDTGAYASVGGPVMERAATHAGGAYYIPNIDVKSKAVYTNNIPCGAMRGFGVNQVTFAIEGLIEKLCDVAGFDRWEIRYNNALDKGLKTTSGHKLRKEVGLKRALESVKDEYKKSKYKGIACGIKNCGIGNGIPELSQVELEVTHDGRIRLFHGWSEMGQGIDTVAQQMLCEYLGLDDISLIDIVVNTDSETRGGSTTASRGTFLVGKAVLAAAENLKRDLEISSLKDLAGKKYRGEYLCDWTTPPNFEGEIISHFAYSFAVQTVILDDSGKIKKVIAVHDSGKVVNRKLFEGQIEGGVVMGLGYGLSEELILDNGQIVNNKFGKLGLLRSSDIPEIKVIPIEIYDDDAPLGAKGVGEISCIPTAAAVAGAYKSFDGELRTKLPIKIKNQLRKK
jgi:selenium-dependent xanthine dehydrogenase